LVGEGDLINSVGEVFVSSIDPGHEEGTLFVMVAYRASVIDILH